METFFEDFMLILSHTIRRNTKKLTLENDTFAFTSYENTLWLNFKIFQQQNKGNKKQQNSDNTTYQSNPAWYYYYIVSFVIIRDIGLSDDASHEQQSEPLYQCITIKPTKQYSECVL